MKLFLGDNYKFYGIGEVLGKNNSAITRMMTADILVLMGKKALVSTKFPSLRFNPLVLCVQ